MLQSRGIARAVPFVGARSQLSGRVTQLSPRIPSATAQHARNFGTRQRQPAVSLLATPLRAKPMTGVSIRIGAGAISTRSLSLWGGSKKTDAAGTKSEFVPETAVPAPSIAEKTPDATAEAIANATTPFEAPVTTDIDLSMLSSAQDILSMPENLGYLKAIGLEYGWGFTSTMQWLLEHIHVYSGWGWAGSIIALSIFMRTVMIAPTIKSQHFANKMTMMKADPRFEESNKELKASYVAADKEAMQRAQIKQKHIREEHGVNMRDMVWGFIQIPFAFGFFRLVTGMTSIPVPSMEAAGWLWFTDLTATDPYMILPAFTAASFVGSLYTGYKANPQASTKTILYAAPPVIFLVSAYMSVALNLMSIVTAGGTLLTTWALNLAPIRRMLGLVPLSDIREATLLAAAHAEAAKAKARGEAVEDDAGTIAAKGLKYEAPRTQQQQNGFAGLREKLSSSVDQAQDDFRKKTGDMMGRFQASPEEKAAAKKREALEKMLSRKKEQEADDFYRKYKGKQ